MAGSPPENNKKEENMRKNALNQRALLAGGASAVAAYVWLKWFMLEQNARYASGSAAVVGGTLVMIALCVVIYRRHAGFIQQFAGNSLTAMSLYIVVAVTVFALVFVSLLMVTIFSPISMGETDMAYHSVGATGAAMYALTVIPCRLSKSID